MSNNFHVGQKVVCVNDATDFSLLSPTSGSARANGLRNGGVYQIVEIPGGEYLHLAGVTNNGWHYSRFRPLVETKTDISIFNETLNDPNNFKIREREDA